MVKCWQTLALPRTGTGQRCGFQDFIESAAELPLPGSSRWPSYPPPRHPGLPPSAISAIRLTSRNWTQDPTFWWRILQNTASESNRATSPPSRAQWLGRPIQSTAAGSSLARNLASFAALGVGCTAKHRRSSLWRMATNVKKTARVPAMCCISHTPVSFSGTPHLHTLSSFMSQRPRHHAHGPVRQVDQRCLPWPLHDLHNHVEFLSFGHELIR